MLSSGALNLESTVHLILSHSSSYLREYFRPHFLIVTQIFKATEVEPAAFTESKGPHRITPSSAQNELILKFEKVVILFRIVHETFSVHPSDGLWFLVIETVSYCTLPFSWIKNSHCFRLFFNNTKNSVTYQECVPNFWKFDMNLFESKQR